VPKTKRRLLMSAMCHGQLAARHNEERPIDELDKVYSRLMGVGRRAKSESPANKRAREAYEARLRKS